ncbi:MAG: helix-turn-helix domain-containing protein [Clostridia bacterium]|nr:helix-turn-helix domain-containing protein [Clostridia bacterium]MBR6788077.1 helix-turn-helix domain-containing protein [Clostridia bacterium]
MDQQILAKIAEQFKDLHSPLYLLDEHGICLVPRDGGHYHLSETLYPGEMARQHGMHYLRLPRHNVIIAAPDSTSDDLIRLGAAMVDALMTLCASSSGTGGAYQRMLLNELSVAELDAVVSEYHIAADVHRCVLLLHMIQVQGRTAHDILSEIVPMSSGDILVPMDNHNAALVKVIPGTDDPEELKQFAAALQETVLGETGLPLTIGIGETAKTAGELHQSYRQARRAIEIGRIYRAEESIHLYSQLLLERFLSDLPPETAAHYHSLLFNRRTSRLFSDEILYTIEMFFRKDLNLSDTARQLYIHRNTLVYRLDKVQRQVGLDLRKFDDAVTFKMLLEMKKCAANKTKKTL